MLSVSHILNALGSHWFEKKILWEGGLPVLVVGDGSESCDQVCFWWFIPRISFMTKNVQSYVIYCYNSNCIHVYCEQCIFKAIPSCHCVTFSLFNVLSFKRFPLFSSSPKLEPVTIHPNPKCFRWVGQLTTAGVSGDWRVATLLNFKLTKHFFFSIKACLTSRKKNQLSVFFVYV